MKPQEKITKQAQDLIQHFSYGWLAEHLNINYRTIKTRLEKHTWLVIEADVINKYHELLIQKLK